MHGTTPCQDLLPSDWVDPLSCRDPADPLAPPPLTNALCAHLEVHLQTGPVLLVLLPRALILLLVWVGHGSFAVLASLLELTDVAFSIEPLLSAVTIHVCIFEVASVGLLKIGEIVSPVAFENALRKVSLVVATVGPFVLAISVFLRVFKLADIFRLVGLPNFCPLAMLAVVEPVSFVAVAVQVREGALPIGLVVLPIADVHVSRGVDQAAIALAKSVHPHALVDRSVGILNRAKAVFNDLASTESCHHHELSFVDISAVIDVCELEKFVDHGLGCLPI